VNPSSRSLSSNPQLDDRVVNAGLTVPDAQQHVVDNALSHRRPCATLAVGHQNALMYTSSISQQQQEALHSVSAGSLSPSHK
jgi:hypothetical protein